MVKLEPSDFASAAARMCEISGVKKTRLCLKLRRKEGKIYLKASDDKTTLTSVLTRQSELRTLEGILGAYVKRCVSDAPEEELTAAQAKKAAAAAAAAATPTVTVAAATTAVANPSNVSKNTGAGGGGGGNNSSASSKKGGKGGKKK